MAHQLESLAFMADKPRVFDMSSPGTGKTFVEIEDFFRSYKDNNDKCLVLAPKSLLESAWGEDIAKFRPELSYSVAWAENREKAFEASADVYITNIDAATWLAKQPAKFFKRFNRLVIDECFVAGTPVDTPDGAKPIEALKVGDLVNTSAGPLPVTFVFENQSNELVEVKLEDGTTITCTPNHPFATESGWIQAGEIRGMRVVRGPVCKFYSPRTAILQPSMFEDSNAPTAHAGAERSNAREAKHSAQRQTILEQRNSLQGRNKSKAKRRAQSKRALPERTRGKRRNGEARVLNEPFTPNILEIPTLRTYAAKKGKRLPIRIQSGLRPSAFKNSGRGRRELAHCAKALGCEKRHLTSLVRVESVSRIECPSGAVVFNLEVNGPHNYFVAGVLVHNCTNFKHPTSQRSKAVAKIAKHFDVRRCMSGTARGNKLTDIWHQAYILDDGKRLGNSFFKFRAASCDPVQRGPGAAMVEWVERPGAAEAVATLLSDISIRHELERCADIPDNHQYTVAHKLPRKLQKVYNEMEMASVAEFKGKIISAPNAAVVANKLLQIASGAVYAPQDEEGEGSYQLLDNSRYNLIGDLIEEREHSIVFFHWRHQRDELMRVCQARNIPFCLYDGSVSDKTRAQVKKDYQAGFYQVMLAHPKSAGHGLTLTRGTATIWASPTHNHELFQQGLQRVYRNTQKQKTENIIIVAPGTVDEFALARCLDRGIKATELHAYLGR